MNIKLIRTFVPSMDFDTSIKFYKELGFKVLWKGEDLCEIGTVESNFFIQDYYVEEYANNFMMQLFVDDLDKLYNRAIKVIENFEGTKVQPIFETEYGRTFHLIDPTGVLWHMSESIKKGGNKAELLCDDNKKN